MKDVNLICNAAFNDCALHFQLLYSYIMKTPHANHMSVYNNLVDWIATRNSRELIKCDELYMLYHESK